MANAPLTGADMQVMFEAIVQDSLDSTLLYQLLNGAKDIIEGERDWEILKVLDSSNAATTAAIALPASTLPYSRTVAMYVNNTPYLQIPFEQKKLFEFSSLRWYLDMRNSNFYLLGSGLTGTVNHCYIYQTPDIEAGTSPVWPARFHRLVVLEAAKQFFAIDQGDRVRSWAPEWNAEYLALKHAMVDWDVKLGRGAVSNAATIDTDVATDLGMM